MLTPWWWIPINLKTISRAIFCGNNTSFTDQTGWEWTDCSLLSFFLCNFSRYGSTHNTNAV